jgi:hypothetical protein
MTERDDEPGAVRHHWRELLPAGAGLTGWIDGSTLWFVCHNQGRGSATLTASVISYESGQLIAELDGVQLVLENVLPERFQAAVVDSDDTVVLLSVLGSAPLPVKVRYKGRQNTFEAGSGYGPWPAADLAVTEESLANRLNDKLFQPLEQLPGAPGHWLLGTGSLDDFADTARARADQRDRGRKAAELRRERDRRLETHFVNPYTFVALPRTGPVRSAPAGHDRCDATRPLVRIDLRWEALTPLATRSQYETGDGGTGLAGSAVKGAVRALHEALTGSCLRIVDLDMAPGHREPMHAGQGRRLVRVHEVTEPSAGEQVIILELARRTVWVDSAQLPVRLTSGQPCDVTGVRGRVDFVAAFGRHQVRYDPDAGPALAGDPALSWVPLLSSTGARKGHRYYVALAAFPPVPDKADLVRVSDAGAAWQRYRRAAASSDDERRRRGDGGLDLAVCWADREVGTRQPVRYELAGPDRIEPGHLLWVTMEAGQVSHLAAAYVWRRGATQPVRNRLPDGLEPCVDPARLCPSCQVFGSGGEAGPDESGGEAGHGYRSHVRFGPMVTDAAPDYPELAPLNAPRLSAGQFYLEPPTHDRAGKGETPLREWDSAADATGARRLRGRKFYWPADPAVQRERRGFAHPRWQIEQVPYRQLQGRGQRAYVWPAGTAFTQTVTVVGLDRVQLGGLLAALRPQLLTGPDGAGWSRAVVRMGYGKPFGLGVLRAGKMQVTVQTPADRYGPRPAPPRQVPDEELAEWIAEFADSAGDEVRACWRDLRAVTDPDHVWPEYVTYPVDQWEDYPRAGERHRPGDYKFRFWKESVGNHQHGIVALQPAHAPDQLLPLRPSEEER